jgi:glycine reductase
MTPVAEMVGSNRIVPGGGIVHPAGDAALDAAAEKKWRRAIVERALQALTTEISQPRIFPRPVR